MFKIIDGKEVAASVRESIKKEVEVLEKDGKKMAVNVSVKERAAI